MQPHYVPKQGPKRRMPLTPYLFPALGDPRAVAVLVHGLNLRPEHMLPLATALQQMQITVVMVALAGHGENYQPRAGLTVEQARLASYRTVTHAQWQADLRQGYAQAATLAAAQQLPCCLVAFSLGGLLGCELFATDPTVTFDRMVLFAPALALQPYAHLPRLFKPWPGFLLRSLAPPGYRANPATPVAAYLALGAALANLRRNLHARLNVPTRIFIARRDALVSVKGLAHLIKQAYLTQWQLDYVHKQGSGIEQRYQHLIINPQSVGAHEWQRMIAQMRVTLLG